MERDEWKELKRVEYEFRMLSLPNQIKQNKNFENFENFYRWAGYGGTPVEDIKSPLLNQVKQGIEQITKQIQDPESSPIISNLLFRILWFLEGPSKTIVRIDLAAPGDEIIKALKVFLRKQKRDTFGLRGTTLGVLDRTLQAYKLFLQYTKDGMSESEARVKIRKEIKEYEEVGNAATAVLNDIKRAQQIVKNLEAGETFPGKLTDRKK